MVVGEAHDRDPVTNRSAPVSGSVFRNKHRAPIGFRHVGSGMDGEAERRDVRAQGLCGCLAVCAAAVVAENGIGQRAGMAEREPVVEARTRSPVQLVGRQVRAQVIAAVVRVLIGVEY